MIRWLTLALLASALFGCDDTPTIRTEVASVFPRGFADDDAQRRFFEVRFALDEGSDPAGLGLPADANVTGVGPALDACRDDRFFVHFPARDWPQVAPADFDEQLGEALIERAWWFRRPNAGADPRPARDHGWLRTNRETQCHVVDALRRAAAVAYGLDPEARDFERRMASIAVGRVCEFTGQVVEDAFDGPMTTWHQSMIDPRGLPALPVLPQVRPQRVDLHLLDSGLAPSRDLPGVTIHAPSDLYSDEAQAFGPPTSHGALMVRLMKQLTGASPDVAYHMWRVLDERGKGTPHDLARALFDISVHAGDDLFPQVLNLSLGWPSDFGQPRLLWTEVDGGSVPACGADSPAAEAVYEDPVGEAVRHALAALNDRNAQGQPVVAFVSTGNVFARPSVADAATQALLAAVPTPDACVDPQEDWESAWFYPAEWGFVPTTCEGAEEDFAVVPVGAVDGLGDAARMTRPGAEPAFVAPGEQVVVRTPRGSVAVSGTSVATAIYSAAAARLQVLAYESQQTPLRAYALARHLYLTGRALSQPEAVRDARNPGGVTAGVRLLNICQAEATLDCRDAACPMPGCPGTPAQCASGPVDCMRAASGQFPGAIASDAVVAACQTCLTACMANSAARCFRRFSAPTWAEAGYAAFDAQRPARVVPDGEVGSSGGRPLRPDAVTPFERDAAGEVLPGPYALGSLGPQPLEPPCPSCAVTITFDQTAARPTAWLKINSALPGRVQAAWLLVQTPNGVAAWSPLSTPPGGWEAGGFYKAAGMSFGAGTGFAEPIAWTKAKAVLWAQIEVTSGKGAGSLYVDASPLYLDLP